MERQYTSHNDDLFQPAILEGIMNALVGLAAGSILKSNPEIVQQFPLMPVIYFMGTGLMNYCIDLKNNRDQPVLEGRLHINTFINALGAMIALS